MSSKTWVGLTFSHLVLGSSPGWWAPTVATYYLSRMVEHPKSKSTKSSPRGHGTRRPVIRTCLKIQSSGALGYDKFIPGRVWLLPSKTGPPFSESLYIRKNVRK